MEICDSAKCTGCFACRNICPKGAINVASDIFGKTTPQVNENKCVKCGLCQKVCPQNDSEGKYFNSLHTCYAAQLKEQSARAECASGGVSSGFAEYMIEQGGVVFGTSFEDGLNLRHVMAATKEEIMKFRGSKYVQSDTGFSYQKTKEELEHGKNVLYVGTPCQIDGLRHYLMKNYDNLVTVDIICHGTPTIKLLKEYVNFICRNKKVKRVSFRGRYDYYFCAFDEADKLIYKKWQNRDKYFVAFSEGLMNRDNCYCCKYTCENRVSDITIGDFWGLHRETLKNKMQGKISVILINTEKGKNFFAKSADKFSYEEREFEEAIKGNPHLQKSVKYTSNTDTFRDVYKEKGILAALDIDYLQKKRRQLLEWDIKKKIKKFIKG